MTNDLNAPGLNQQWQHERQHPNLVVLDYCQYSVEDDTWSQVVSIPEARANIFSALGLDQIQGYQPWYLTQNSLYPAPKKVALRYEVSAAFKPGTVGLAVEQLSKWRVFVNGKLVDSSAATWLWDRSLHHVDISATFQAGNNVIELHSTLQNELEIEDIFVTGDFGVSIELGRRPQLIEEPASLKLGDWTTQGYPFFTGVMRYTQEVDLQGISGNSVFLRLPEVAGACVSVLVNDGEPRWLAWQPWEVDITTQMVPGVNRIAIDVYTSLRNAFGPFHHVDANQLTWTGPDEFEPGEHWTDDYVLQPHGLLGDVQLGSS